MVNFEKGKWYRRKEEWDKVRGDWHYYFKCAENSNKTTFTCSEIIRRNGEYKKEDYASERNDLLNIPIDLNIIIPFLPMNHPDREIQINSAISNLIIW